MNDWQVQNMAKIIQKYNARLYHEALSILQDAQLAEDAVQEACFNALKFPDKIFAAECPKTCRYFVVIVRRVAFNMYNKRKKEALPVDPLENVTFLHTEDTTQSADEHLRLEEIIKQIPKDQQDLVFLLLSDYTQKEIAELTGIPYETVRKRIQRARKQVEKQLDIQEDRG